MKQTQPLHAWALGMAGACVLTTVQAHPPQPTQAPEAAATVAEAQTLRAVRDKATGKLRAPTAEEMKALLAAERADRKARGLPETPEARPVVVTRHASGMRSAVLGVEHMVTLQATRRPDGSLALQHDDPAHEHPRSSAAPTAAAKE